MQHTVAQSYGGFSEQLSGSCDSVFLLLALYLFAMDRRNAHGEGRACLNGGCSLQLTLDLLTGIGNASSDNPTQLLSHCPAAGWGRDLEE